MDELIHYFGCGIFEGFGVVLFVYIKNKFFSKVEQKESELKEAFPNFHFPIEEGELYD